MITPSMILTLCIVHKVTVLGSHDNMTTSSMILTGCIFHNKITVEAMIRHIMTPSMILTLCIVHNSFKVTVLGGSHDKA